MSVLHITAIKTTSFLLSLCGKTQLYMNNFKMCKEQLNFMTDSMHSGDFISYLFKFNNFWYFDFLCMWVI